MEQIEIKNRWTDKIVISGKYESIKDCLEKNRGANLRGANLEGANLRGANLEGANLEGANLEGANLEGAYLRGANLRGANLEGAYLRGANLEGAYLRGANLEGAYLKGAYLRGAYLKGAYLRGANLRGAYLEGANLRGAYLEGAKDYYMSHDFWMEIIRGQPIKTFTDKEWMMIGQIIVHRICWDTIKKRYDKKIMPVFKKITKTGFGEFEEHYKQV